MPPAPHDGPDKRPKPTRVSPPRGKPGFGPGGGKKFGPPAGRLPRGGGRVDLGQKQSKQFDLMEARPGMLGPGVRIVHEDADLIVIDKPPGLLTAGMMGETRVTLMDLVKRHVFPRGFRRSRNDRDTDHVNETRVGVVHRLDKEASGLVVFSKTDKAFTWLKEDFKAKRVHRIYLALVEGELGAVGESGTMQSFMRELPDGRVESIAPDAYRGRLDQAGDDDPMTARLAVTHYRVIGVGQGRTLVQVRLETGRKNQIRVHMAERGCPLVGDERHGAKSDPMRRLALHASELGFTHPSTGQKERYRSHAPAPFYRLVGMDVPQGSVDDETGPNGAPAPVTPPRDTSWNQVAGWYDDMIGQGKSDHYTRVIIPGTIRVVGPSKGQRILDVACGQGVISRAMSELGASVVGVDLASELVEAGKRHGGDRVEYHAHDARELASLKVEGNFDQATCVMALSNIEPLEPVLAGVASLLKPGGAFTFVISHPAFRAPGQTEWGWDNAKAKQYRRVDGYLSPGQHAIVMHPGKAARGAAPTNTWTFHRPLQTYVRVLNATGFAIEQLEEWAGQRESTSGPRAAEENRARREIPLFLCVRAIKLKA